MKQKSKYPNLRIAITGNIGSGKSTFAKFIHEFEYPVIYADHISKEILANDSTVRQKVTDLFGAQSYRGKRINNEYIAKLVFSEPKNLKKINSILHPLVKDKISELLEKLISSSRFVFVEAALIYEARFEKMFDYVVLITADEKIRMKRFISNKHSSEKDFLERENNQIKQEVKKKRADFTFSNNGSIADLNLKAGLLIKILEASII